VVAGAEDDATPVARSLRDAGHEVVLVTGGADQVVAIGIQEDVKQVVVCSDELYAAVSSLADGELEVVRG
jgi:methylmalonyl-CoA mutase cobalamin-binding subunit